MRRLVYVLGVAVPVFATAFVANAIGRFDEKLPPDRQIVHVLNRMAFGPRSSDIEEVRRIGLDKWIDAQLHPDRINENPTLEAKLKPLETLQLATWEIVERYPAAPPGMMMLARPLPLSLITPVQNARLMNGSVQERIATLDSLNSEIRQRILSSAPPQLLDGLPDAIQQEATKLRQAEAEERQKEMRRMNPPLNELLNPDQIRIARMGTKEEKAALLNSFDAEKRRQILRALGPQTITELPEFRREAMAATQPQLLVNSELIENKLYRALYSNRQLQEVLVDFWLNHFNVFNGKAQDRVLLTSYERDAIRPHVLGRFKDLLLATARHPAMLFYLDNWQSQALREDIVLPAGARRPGLNENYGRELLELHTLGVDGGYTQADVVAVARAFTGWTIYDLPKYAEFQFNAATHDRKEKIVLGHTLPTGRGEQDGLDVIDILARHPSTARFISKKLAQRFVADDPPQSLVDRMAATFMKTDGDLRSVMQTMFASTAFLSEAAWQAKFKSPLEMVVSALRVLNADVSDTFVIAQRIADLGQPLYGKLEPSGYPNTGETWINTSGLLGRINFAAALAAGEVSGARVDMTRFNFKDARTIATHVLSMPPSPSTLAAIEKGIQQQEATPSLLTMLVLSSPEFQRR
jgi:uncharacterized protein (DUF1800 family)